MNLDLIEELSLPNYTAITFLERLDAAVDQEKIDRMEAMILLATYPKKVTPEIIKRCVGDDTLAYLFLHLRNQDLRE
jgi:hypothetical protein